MDQTPRLTPARLRVLAVIRDMPDATGWARIVAAYPQAERKGYKSRVSYRTAFSRQAWTLRDLGLVDVTGFPGTFRITEAGRAALEARPVQEGGA